MPRAWRVKESHHGRSLKQKDTQRFFILLFSQKRFRASSKKSALRWVPTIVHAMESEAV